MLRFIVVSEDASSDDDVEQFVARMIVEPPPPLSCDGENTSGNMCPALLTISSGEVIVTSASARHVTSTDNEILAENSNAASYRRASCIDKTTDTCVSLPIRRASDLTLLAPQKPFVMTDSGSESHWSYSNKDRATESNLQPAANDARCPFRRHSLRWYDAVYDSRKSSTDVATDRSAASLRPISLPHE